MRSEVVLRICGILAVNKQCNGAERIVVEGLVGKGEYGETNMPVSATYAIYDDLCPRDITLQHRADAAAFEAARAEQIADFEQRGKPEEPKE